MIGIGTIESENQYAKKPIVNTSLVFGGTTNDYVQINNPLSSQTATTQEWTVISDLKLQDRGDSQILLNNWNNGLALAWGTTKNPLLYLNGGTNDYYKYGTQNVVDGASHTIAFGFRNSDATRDIYVDGVRATNDTAPNLTSTPSGILSQIKIGYLTKGSIGYLQIWNRLLTQAEIVKYSSVELTGNESGLVGYWKMDEGAGTIVRDYSPSKNHGVIYGNTKWEESKKSSHVLSLDGVNGYVAVPNSSSLDITGPFTIKAKVKIKGLPTGIAENNFVQKNGYSQYRIGINSSGAIHTTVQLTDGTTPTFFNDYGSSMFYPVLNKWYTYHYIFDGLNVSLYVDGILFGSKVVTTGFNTVVSSTSAVNFGFYSGYYSNIDLDHVEIWNRAILPQEIKETYETPSDGDEFGLVGCWSLNEAVGAIIRDRTSYRNNGTIYGGTKWKKADDSVSTLVLDGVNDYGRCPLTPYLEISNNWTIEAIVNTSRQYPSDTTATLYRGIVCKARGGGSGDLAYSLDWFGTNTSKTLRFIVGDVTNFDSINISDFSFSGDTHIAATLGGGNMNLYVNGVLVGTKATTRTAQPLSTYPMEIGRAFATGFWDGEVKKVRVWNKVLTVNEIKANMTQAFTGYETGILGCWNMDRGVGDILLDSSPNGSHAIISGGTTWKRTRAGRINHKIPYLKHVSNMTFWFDATRITLAENAIVTQWNDLSGNNKHAVQATAGIQPIFKNKAVYFDGTDDYLTLPLTTAQTVFVVTKVDKLAWNTVMSRGYGLDVDGIRTASGTGYSNPGNSNDYFGTEGATKVFVNGYPTTVFTSGARHIGSFYRGTGMTGSFGAIGAGYVADPRYLKGEVCEIIGYDKVLTTAERKQVEAYLGKKWGIGVAP